MKRIFICLLIWLVLAELPTNIAAAYESDEKKDKTAVEIQERLDKTIEELIQQNRLTKKKLMELEKKVSDNRSGIFDKSFWADRITIGGDIRLRYQYDYMDKLNEPRPGESGFLEETTNDRQRLRYRTRLGLKARLIDPRDINVGKVEVELRVSTGSDDDPVSTNETMGDYNSRDDFCVDRASLSWTFRPRDPLWGGRIPQISLTGGRMANPFFSTDLVWDTDINFEGITLSLISDTAKDNSWRIFLTGGIYPLEEIETKQRDKWLYGGQIGLAHRPFKGLNFKLAAAYYDFHNVQGEPVNLGDYYSDPEWDWSSPRFIQGGNTLYYITGDISGMPGVEDAVGLASEFEEINLTAMIDMDLFSPIHLVLWGDYVENKGYDKKRVLELDPLIPHYALDQTEAYQVGMVLGYPKVRSFADWNCSLFYKRVEADAVLDAFTDSDFHGGGTDAKGWILGAQFGLYKNVWFSAKWRTADEILTEYGQLAIDILQIDINAVF